jgi:hypothetical protein
MSQAVGSYSKAGVSTSSVGNLLPNGMTTPWGGSVTVQASGSTQYTVTIGTMPASVCPIVAANIVSNPHISGVSGCTSSANNFTYTYNAVYSFIAHLTGGIK